MSHQLTFADSEFSTKRRQTRKEIFLSRMEQILPWQNMTAVIEPFYPKAGNGRRPYPLETMLRIHCMQHWYNLSDGAMEDALYEIASMRLFARLSLDSALPDRTTIMNFRHLLEQHQLARQLFKTINRWLAEAGVMMGTVAKLAMRQPFVLFKGLTFQKLCLPGAFRPGDHHNKMLRPG
ncbi:transposase, partial [Enterobacter ludwigii]|uniref:transposase n=1 Tax=Enterobacter ludwigii TaxID=299767 RepID=UPI00215B43FE